MNRCPVNNCGRTFETASVLEEHLRRRHPKQYELLNTVHTLDKAEEQIAQDEISKLPKIKQLRMQSRQQRPVEVYRKSLSKTKQEPKNKLNASKITTVIADSRTYLETTEQSQKKSKRPSLSKKGSSSELVNIKHERLPELKAIRHKKLQILAGHGPKPSKAGSHEQQDPMAMTAPSFYRVKSKQFKQKSKSKEKINPDSTYLQDDSHIRKVHADKIVLVKTQQGFHEKESKLHHHPRQFLRRTSDRDKNLEKTQDTFIEQIKEPQLEKQVVSPINEPKKELSIKKQPKIKHALKRDSSLRKPEVKSESVENINFQERIVVLKSTVNPRLTIPSNAKCEFIYANNCNLNSVNLNSLQTLRELSIQHNKLKDLTFLNYACNYNIQKIFVDHNKLTSLDYLPPNVKIISATFNTIEGLQNNSRELSALNSLQEIDLTFNPIRKEPNYKLHMISSCQTLKKIDGIKITKFDLQLAAEYSRLLDEELGLVPSNKFRNLVVSKCSGSPSTVISTEYQQEPEQIGMTYEQLQKEIAKLTKITKQTQQNLSIIKQENQIIRQQIAELKGKEEEVRFDSEALYEKLKVQCEALQLLNFLQYASEQELEQLIAKKQQEMVLA